MTKTRLGFTHFTSDLHYFHGNIIKYCSRPFRDVAHQVDELIARFNCVVGDDDHTLFCGDLFLGSKNTEVISRLNGKKTLVCGNHDKHVTTTKLLSFGFEAIHRGSLYDEMNGVKVCYNHFPYAPLENTSQHDVKYLNLRPARETDVVLIHGHTHSAEKFNAHDFSVHVGVDAWDFRPVTFEETWALVQHCFEQKQAIREQT